MPTTMLITKLAFEKCTQSCKDNLSCYPWIDRHWPFNGTEGTNNRLSMTPFGHLHIMVAPGSRAWLLQGKLADDIMHAPIPKGYRLFYSNRYGAEDWGRYWWYTAHVPPLSVGDVVEENYHRIASSEYYEKHYFLVLEDARTHLWLLRIDRVPKDPAKLVRELLD